MKELKKKNKFFKYYTLFLQEKLFFVCLLNKHKDYSFLRKQLVLNNFKIKFIQNGFLQNLTYFYNVKTYLTGQIFCVLKNKFDYNDYSILKNILFKDSHVILFYIDNKFYSSEKLQFLKSYFQSKISNLPQLSYFYFLVKLGFILKLEKFNQIQYGRVRMT
jgi:hypothetical protein